MPSAILDGLCSEQLQFHLLGIVFIARHAILARRFPRIGASKAMERFVRLRSRLTRIRTGPLGEYIELFVNELSEQGYSVDVICTKIWLLDSFGTWLKSNRLTAAGVDGAQIEKYLRQ
jgi:hypothetical protein